LEQAFIERCFLLGGGEFADFGEVDVLPGFEHVIANDPIRRDGIVEPDELGFVGVAAIARLLEDLFYFGRGLHVGGDGRIGKRETDELKEQEENEESADCAK
jgi:hypothetical protein